MNDREKSHNQYYPQLRLNLSFYRTFQTAEESYKTILVKEFNQNLRGRGRGAIAS